MAAPRRLRRTRGWLGIALLCAAVPAGAGGLAGLPWVDDVLLAPAERREFVERRAVLKARADDWAARTVTCPDFRSHVREALAGVQHVRAVEVGVVVLTSQPPQIPVTFAIALDSGRVVWDRITVAVPMRPRVVLLHTPAGAVPASGCGAAPR